VPEPDRAELARTWVRGLTTAGSSIEGADRVLRQLVSALSGASGFRAADPVERRELLARFAVDQALADLPDHERTALAELARRADRLDDVYFVQGRDTEMPIAWAPDSGRMVLLFE
jgi:hypothetical protein